MRLILSWELEIYHNEKLKHGPEPQRAHSLSQGEILKITYQQKIIM